MFGGAGLLTFLIFLGISVNFLDSSPFKMVIIFGKPLNYTTSTVRSTSFADCVTYCQYDLDTCMAVYSEWGADDCQVFEWGQLASVQEMDESSGEKVAIRMNASLISTCPLNPEDNTMTNGGMTMPIYSITHSNGIWRFPPIPYCPFELKLFNRTKGLWCLGVLRPTVFITQPYATNLCSTAYGGGVLTGLENEQEFNFVVEEAIEILQRPASLEIRAYNYSGIWVNGERRASCKSLPTTPRPATCNGTNEFTFTDPLLSDEPTGYLWGTSQPSGYRAADSNCIYVQFNNSAMKTTMCDDYRCDLEISSPNSTAFMGMACGVQPEMLT